MYHVYTYENGRLKESWSFPVIWNESRSREVAFKKFSVIADMEPDGIDRVELRRRDEILKEVLV